MALHSSSIGRVADSGPNSPRSRFRPSSMSRSRLSTSPSVYRTNRLPSSISKVRLRMIPSPTPSGGDRKSTRLNSSHPSISYAVFRLKKKKTKDKQKNQKQQKNKKKK